MLRGIALLLRIGEALLRVVLAVVVLLMRRRGVVLLALIALILRWVALVSLVGIALVIVILVTSTAAAAVVIWIGHGGIFFKDERKKGRRGEEVRMKEDCYKLMYGFFWLRGGCLEAAEMMSCSARFSFSHGFLFFVFLGR